jgi:HK97 family phage major capsid protein
MKRSFKIVKLLFAVLLIATGMAALNLGAVEGTLGILMAFPLLLAGIENSDDAKVKRSQIWDDMQKMLDARKTEKRSFTDDEDKKYKELRADFDKLTEHIKELEADEKRAFEMTKEKGRRSAEDKEKQEIGKYSIKRMLQFAAKGQTPDGLEGEMHQEAEKDARASGLSLNGAGVPDIVLRSLAEKRAMTATGQTTTAGDQGGMLIPTVTSGLLMALRPLLVLNSLGANFMGGMIGNYEFVKGTSTVAAWDTENGEADETSVATSKVTMSPNRLAAFTKISKQLMVQTPENIENMVWNDILRAVAQKVEQAAINGSGQNNEPTGILNTTGIGSVLGGENGADPTWDHLVKLEKEIAIDNALMGRLAYLTNHKVKAMLKTTKIDIGSGLFVWPQNASELNGYPVGVSNLVPSTLSKGNQKSNLSAILFGDFNELKVGQWGGIDVVVDPYTLAGTNQLKITTNSFWDVALVFPEKFAAIVDVKTGDASVATTTAAATTTD